MLDPRRLAEEVGHRNDLLDRLNALIDTPVVNVVVRALAAEAVFEIERLEARLSCIDVLAEEASTGDISAESAVKEIAKYSSEEQNK